MGLSNTSFIADKNFWITTLIAIIPFSVFGQILNIEKSRLPEDSTRKVVGNISISYSLNNRSPTPAEKVIFKGLIGNSNIGYFTPKKAYLFFGNINYTSITGAPPISTGYAHGRINFNRKKKLSEEVFTQVQYDESREMKYRALGGLGLRLNLHKTQKTDVYVGSGIMWETEEWVSPNDNDSIVVKNIPKSSNYFSIKLKLNPYTNFNFINYYQVGYDNKEQVIRHRLSLDASLVILINKYLSFTNSFNGGYENRPIVPIQRFVYSISNGILIKF